MHEVLVNRLGGLSLPSKSVVRLTDRPDMTLDVYGGRKTSMQQCKSPCLITEEIQYFNFDVQQLLASLYFIPITELQINFVLLSICLLNNR